jgi:two-component system chemotaxis response regulator CheB
MPNGRDEGLLALERGAIDLIQKPKFGMKRLFEESRIRICETVKAAARVRPRWKSEARRGGFGPPRGGRERVPPLSGSARALAATDRVIAIGAASGAGMEALRVVLGGLPASSPAVVVALDLPEGYPSAFARRLASDCSVAVKEAGEDEQVEPGKVIFAPADRHLVLVRDGIGYRTKLRAGPLVSGHRPAADVLFRSVARSGGRRAVGVVLSGAGGDGAGGLAEIKAAGGRTLAQDEASSLVFEMPRSAVERNAAELVLPLEHIAATITRLCDQDPGGAALG